MAVENPYITSAIRSVHIDARNISDRAGAILNTFRKFRKGAGITFQEESGIRTLLSRSRRLRKYCESEDFDIDMRLLVCGERDNSGYVGLEVGFRYDTPQEIVHLDESSSVMGDYSLIFYAEVGAESFYPDLDLRDRVGYGVRTASWPTGTRNENLDRDQRLVGYLLSNHLMGVSRRYYRRNVILPGSICKKWQTEGKA